MNNIVAAPQVRSKDRNKNNAVLMLRFLRPPIKRTGADDARDSMLRLAAMYLGE